MSISPNVTALRARTSRPRTPRARIVCFALVNLLLATGVWAQAGSTGDTGIDSSGQYNQEVAWCRANTTATALADCLKGSWAARAEKRRGVLDNNGGNFDSNALKRCQPFSGDDLAACRARVAGLGNASGSVAGGGQLRWVETVVLPPTAAATVILLPAAKN